ncbi:BclA C-terminal domain-containing protein [Novisyntrophococcus fermenticellae]|uniref:BclA C-terminal domain-containing protein n=1 Tax=Novisyntrophococcus fermenticellae TaxID=2068655 RepID=UPI001E2F6C07|nr:hypothetical protein [Novisyntrophococcus fermenticellae]
MSTAGFIALTDTPVTVPLPEQSSASAGLDFATADNITIVEDGVYRVDFHVLGSYGEIGNVNVSLAIDGTPQPGGMLAYELLASELITFTLTNYYTLTAGAQLSLQMFASVPGNFFFAATGPSATLSVERVA